MSRLIAIGLLMGVCIVGHTQEITVTDQNTGQPLSSVAISSKSGKKVVVTDSTGKADVSALSEMPIINLRMIGYEPIITNYEALKNSDFSMQLTPSVMLLNEVVVSSFKEDVNRQTSLHIEPLHLTDIAREGTFNLTDALAKVPGVTQLTTGIGVSKPVIRGLYSNRILVLFSGLRFDNQQWQDEHGLGLSDIGISKVEIIKGPLSLLYGTEAVGGVINIIEEQAPPPGTVVTDFGLEAHSNTGGGTVQAGVKAKKGNRWFRLRVATTNHADYSDGNSNRVLNSRFNGYYLKGSYGFEKDNWKSDNYYHFSYNQFGFIFSDSNDFTEEDSRWSRDMAGPHHIVMLNMLTSINEIPLKNSKLKFNVGLQSNLRSEDEGASEISLNMHLLTGQYALKWNKSLGDKLNLVVANSTSVENNKNYGRRKIVPDAQTVESSVSAYLKQNLGQVIMEYGGGGGLRHIKTLLTPTVNSAEKEIEPFQQTRSFVNGMLGVSFIPNSRWDLKINASSGVRAPNLAELSSNGLHEGIYTYEVGDPDMDNERNINGDVGLHYLGNQWQFSLSGFYNYFNGYIYLEPTNEEWFGFPVYRFKQHGARLYGGEASIALTPNAIKGLKIAASYSGLIGKLDNGDYLPYMPAEKIKPEVRYSVEKGGSQHMYAFVNNAFVLAQNQVNSEETTTPGYNLLNVGAGIIFKGNKATYDLSIAANNIMNEAYYDHLSRFKTLGFLNIGRDISLNLKINFTNNLNKQ